jgi:hypothetical protein
MTIAGGQVVAANGRHRLYPISDEAHDTSSLLKYVCLADIEA